MDGQPLLLAFAEDSLTFNFPFGSCLGLLQSSTLLVVVVVRSFCTALVNQVAISMAVMALAEVVIIFHVHDAAVVFQGLWWYSILLGCEREFIPANAGMQRGLHKLSHDDMSVRSQKFVKGQFVDVVGRKGDVSRRVSVGRLNVGCSNVKPLPRRSRLSVQRTVRHVKASSVLGVPKNPLKEMILRAPHLPSQVGNDTSRRSIVR